MAQGAAEATSGVKLSNGTVGYSVHRTRSAAATRAAAQTASPPATAQDRCLTVDLASATVKAYCPR